MTTRKSKPQTSTFSSPFMAQQKSTRITRSKRAHSDDEETSMSTEKPPLGTSTPAKRARLDEQVNREELVHTREQTDPVTSSPMKHTRFEDDSSTPQTSPSASNAATKMPVKRRMGSLPSVDSEAKKFRTASARKASSNDSPLASLPLTPLRSQLTPRMERMRYQSGTSEKATMQLYDIEFDDMMVIDTEKPLPAPVQAAQERLKQLMSAAKTSLQVDAVSKLTKLWDKERQELNSTISTLAHENGLVKEDLQVIHIGLRNLVDDKDKTAKAIVEEIREARDALRETLLLIAPEALEDGDSLLTMLYACSDALNKTAMQDKTKSAELDIQASWVAQLHAQVVGLLDRLASSEVNAQTTEEEYQELAAQCEAHEEEISGLDEDLTTMTTERDKLEKALAERGKQLVAAETLNEELRHGLERLKKSLQSYREDEERLHSIITKTEAEHKEKLKKMHSEYKKSLHQRNEQISATVAERDEAEKELAEQQSAVGELKEQLEESRAGLSKMQQDVIHLETELQITREAQEKAEVEAQQNANTIDELGAHIKHVEEQLSENQESFYALQNKHASDHARLMDAKQLLEAARAEVVRQQETINRAGIEKNELIFKAFEVQGKFEKQIADNDKKAYAELKSAKYSFDMEHAKHEAALHQLKEQKSQLAEHKQELMDLLAIYEEDAGHSSLALHQRDAQLQEQSQRIIALSQDLSVSKEQRHAAGNQAADERKELKDTIQSLKNSMSEHEARLLHHIRLLHTLSREHEGQIRMYEHKIRELEDKLEENKNTIADLEKANLNLESRVEHEALQMLQMELTKQEEIDQLREEIHQKEQHIANITAKSRKTDETWQATFEARTEQLRYLEEEVANIQDRANGLEDQNHALKQMFKHYTEQVDARVLNMADAGMTARDRIVQQQALLHEESQKLFKAVDSMSDENEGIKRARRDRDSGIVI